MNTNIMFQTELKSIAKYGGMNFFGIFFVNVMGYVINIIITRNVEVEQFGQFVLSMRIISYLGLLALLGFNTTTVKFISQYFSQKKHNEIIGTMRYILSRVLISPKLPIFYELY